VCRQEGIKINEVSLPLSEITSYESVFITGTSRKILPVRQIDDMVFSAENELIKRISLKFDIMTNEYIRQRKI
jgi:branched-chain amino acid aminotransferase